MNGFETEFSAKAIDISVQAGNFRKDAGECETTSQIKETSRQGETLSQSRTKWASSYNWPCDRF